MKWLLPAILLSLTCCHDQAELIKPRPSSTAPIGLPVTVVSNQDGDRLTVMMGERRMKVRLEGIDAPEKRQAFSAASKAALSAILADGPVCVIPTGKDRYGRTLAHVQAGGRVVSLEMIRLGWAWHFLRYNKDKDLAAAEIEARKLRRGLWADSNPVPPWEWRKVKKTPEITAP